MSTITTEQLSTILVEKLDEKLAPLNSTVTELSKSLHEVIKHVKFVDAKYDEERWRRQENTMNWK